MEVVAHGSPTRYALDLLPVKAFAGSPPYDFHVKASRQNQPRNGKHVVHSTARSNFYRALTHSVAPWARLGLHAGLMFWPIFWAQVRPAGLQRASAAVAPLRRGTTMVPLGKHTDRWCVFFFLSRQGKTKQQGSSYTAPAAYLSLMKKIVFLQIFRAFLCFCKSAL